MPRLTGRGFALLGLAAATYLMARVIGTWELYLLALMFLAVVVISWLMVAVSGRKVWVSRSLTGERLVDGDEPEMLFVVTNRSVLPSPELTLLVESGGLGSRDFRLGLDSLPPRGTRELHCPIGRANRGVHTLPPVKLTVLDPLGVAKAAHRASDPLVVTVLPRTSYLWSCAVCPEFGLKHEWSGRHGLSTAGAAEFRGIRPHQPGEPLSRIDWKSTAKTGVLMLREMEEPAGADLTLILDGTIGQLRGEPPDSNYEMAVQAAGSIADFVLRSGRGVTLVRHEKNWTETRLNADAAGQQTLLQALAEARPDASAPLSHLLRRLRREARHLLRAQGVTVVAIGLDETLTRSLLELREDGTRLALVYVVGSSFPSPESEHQSTRTSHLLPFLPPRGTSPGTEQTPPFGSGPPPEVQRLLLSLVTAGVPCLTLYRGDNLVQRLSAWEARLHEGAVRESRGAQAYYASGR